MWPKCRSLPTTPASWPTEKSSPAAFPISSATTATRSSTSFCRDSLTARCRSTTRRRTLKSSCSTMENANERCVLAALDPDGDPSSGQRRGLSADRARRDEMLLLPRRRNHAPDLLYRRSLARHHHDVGLFRRPRHDASDL